MYIYIYIYIYIYMLEYICLSLHDFHSSVANIELLLPS